ncbi:hypothetical protein BH11CYA1_BH11CYA1_12960 [soil metagenome]
MTEICITCGKPPVANRAGSVTSYFFQQNYCQCHNKSEDEQELGSNSSSLGKFKSSEADNGDQVCSNCGKSRPTNRRAGSFTAFLFKELRCNCAGPASKSGAKNVKNAQGASATSRGRRPANRSRTAARVAQRKQFTESYRESKISGEATGESAFRPGSVIGGAFRIGSIVGRGGMGVVYLAEQMSLRKQVALKVLAPELVNEQSWRRFQAEAKILAPLNHSSLVKVYDLGIHEQKIPYYSMDFLDGQSLEEILSDDGPMPLKQTLSIFVDVLNGLAYAHRNGIIHRDIKPGNIMLCTAGGDNVVKILDFGISKLVGPNAANLQSLTAVGEIFGSPFYMSPEQCAGSAVDARSDIYSVGCTLIEALSGFVPFEGEQFLETVLMHQEEEPPLLSDLNPDLKYPPSLDQVLAKSLAKRPLDRYQSAKEMALDLGRVLEGKTVSAKPERSSFVPAVESSASRRPARARASQREFDSVAPSHWLPIALAVGAILALTAVFAFMILGPTEKIAGSANSANSFNSVISEPASPAVTTDKATADKSTADKATEALPDTQIDKIFIPISTVYDPAQDPHGSETDSAMFSTVFAGEGRGLRRFKFPTDTVIGNIGFSDGSFLQAAKGLVDFDLDKKLAFFPNVIVGRFPQYMKRFRAGDVKAVFFWENACSDSVCEAVSSIPGVSEVRINGSKRLTANGLKVLKKFKELDSLSFASSELTGEDLAAADCWRQMRVLVWKNAIKPQALLEKLQSSQHLTSLNLSSRKLTHSDYQLISKLSSLESLSLPSNTMTIDDLVVVANLPRVTALDIRGCGLGTKVIPILSKMKNLRNLRMLQASSSTELKAKLINQLPRVRVYGWSDVN